MLINCQCSGIVPFYPFLSLLPDMETLTGLQRPHTTNPTQRKPYFNLPIPAFQNTSILFFFEYHTIYTLWLHSLLRKMTH